METCRGKRWANSVCGTAVFLALIMVEAFYWFSPCLRIRWQSSRSRGLDLERVTNLICGEGSAVISHHNGWLTRIDLQHPNFPGPYDSVGLYVSDECAGVHEMIFLSTCDDDRRCTSA